MSLQMVFTIIQLLPLRTPSNAHSVESSSDDGWPYWLYLLSSNGIYSVLVSLILFCCVLNALQKKFGYKNYDVDMNINVAAWVDRVWKNVGGSNVLSCGPLKTHHIPGFGLNLADYESEINSSTNLIDHVLMAEGELGALRNAVDLARRAGVDLEETLEEVEKDKDEIEGRSLVAKKWLDTEVKTVKTEMESLQEQLSILKKEKNEVLARCECLEEEAQKAGYALKQRQEMQEKLDEALTVVSVLKQAVSDLEADKEEAILSLGCEPKKTSGDDSLSLFKNITERKLTRSQCLDDLHLLDRGDDLRSETLESSVLDSYEDQGYGEMMSSSWGQYHDEQTNYTNDRGQTESAEEELDEYEKIYDKTNDELDEEQIEMSRTVQLTNSAAFRQFLQTNFGPF